MAETKGKTTEAEDPKSNWEKRKKVALIGIGIIIIISFFVFDWGDTFSFDTWSSKNNKWDDKIVLTQEGVWSRTVRREAYQDIHWEQLEGSASTFEIRDEKHPEITYPFAEGAQNVNTKGQVFNYQLRILSKLKEVPVVFGYRITTR